MKIPQVVPCLAAVVLCAIVTVASAQDSVDDLRLELQQLKAEYEQRIQTLENRLQALEGSPAATAMAAEPNPPSVEERLAALEETNERATLDFAFEGYLRAGYGDDGKGNAQSAFQAPNSGAKYRLGNEAETYMEATFLARTPPDQIAGDDLSFETKITLAYFTPLSDNNTFDTTTSLREAYAKVGGVLPTDPGTEFWAGERFYSRYDIHVNDFYYRDMSGYGGGIENLTLGDNFAKLSVAWLGGSADELDADGTAFPERSAQFSKNSLDVGLTDIAVPGGTLSVLGTFSSFEGDTFVDDEGRDVTLDDSNGVAATLIHDSDLTEHLHNRFVVQYGNGAAHNFRSQLLAPPGLDESDLAEVDVDDFRTWRVLNQLELIGADRWSVLSVLLYEDTDIGTSQFDRVRWFSAGVRPIYHFTDHVSLAIDAGYDHTDQDDGLSGSLFKLTLAPQITPRPRAYSRPSIRGYITYAWWDDEFRGSVGAPSFDDDTEGFAAGIQVETWW